jgi:hypothetical protein
MFILFYENLPTPASYRYLKHNRMKKNIQISIPKPCHEKWNSFTSTAQGGFCYSCEKEVIDFTSWSEERIKMYFKNASGNMCGRFRQEQLKVYECERTHITALGWLPVFFTGILLLFSSQQAKAQGTVKPKLSTEQYESKKRISGDNRGKVSIENPGSAETLVRKDVGLPSGECTINTTRQKQEINMQGEVHHYVLGGAQVYHKLKWYSPRRWWRGIKSLF